MAMVVTLLAFADSVAAGATAYCFRDGGLSFGGWRGPQDEHRSISPKTNFVEQFRLLILLILVDYIIDRHWYLFLEVMSTEDIVIMSFQQ